MGRVRVDTGSPMRHAFAITTEGGHEVPRLLHRGLTVVDVTVLLCAAVPNGYHTESVMMVDERC